MSTTAIPASDIEMAQASESEHSPSRGVTTPPPAGGSDSGPKPENPTRWGVESDLIFFFACVEHAWNKDMAEAALQAVTAAGYEFTSAQVMKHWSHLKEKRTLTGLKDVKVKKIATPRKPAATPRKRASAGTPKKAGAAGADGGDDANDGDYAASATPAKKRKTAAAAKKAVAAKAEESDAVEEATEDASEEP